MRKKLLAGLASLTLLGLTGSISSAAEIVDWNGTDTNYVTATAKYRGSDGTTASGTADWEGDGADDSVRRFAYSESSTLNPPSPATTYDITARSAIFYGGLEEWRINTTGTPGSNGEEVINDATLGGFGDFHQAFDDTNGSDRRAVGAFVWLKQDFLLDDPNAQTATVYFAAGDSIAVDVVKNGANHFNWRGMVKDGTQWYVSQFSSTIDNSFDPSAVNWAAFDPALNLQANRGAAAGGLIFSAHAFTDITAVGLYIESTSTNGATNREFDWRQFTVNASVVPEPASLALLGLGSLLMLRRRRTV